MKPLKCFLFMLAVCIMLCACSTQSTPQDVQQNEQQDTQQNDTKSVKYFRLASNQSENYVSNQACSRFCELVKQRSDGTICIEPYFDSELGSDDEALEQCRLGGVDFARVSSTAAVKYVPLLDALQMPYEYTSYQHLFRVLDSEIGQSVLESFSLSDLTGLAYFYSGYRCFFSTEQIIDSKGSLQGLRLRVSASSSMSRLLELCGAEAIFMSEDKLPSALRSGEIDGAESTLPAYVDSGYYHLAPNWVYDRHIYNTDVLVASAQTMALLSGDEQELIQECAAEAAKWQREHWINAETSAMMCASRNGCRMVVLDEEETAALREAAQPLYDELTEEQQRIVQSVGLYADTEW